MEKTITAVFESPDAAELALIDMRRGNIPILQQTTRVITDFERKKDIFYMAPIYATRRLDDDRQAQVPIPPLRDIPPFKSERLYRDVVSNDVVLELTVPDSHADMTRQKLISNHAHRVSQW